MKDALIITNSDATAEVIRQARVGRNVVPWRAALYDGPVDLTQNLEVLLAALKWRGRASDVILWFGPDLSDQLRLLQLLDYFGAEEEDERPRLWLIQAGGLLSQETPSTIHRHLALRRPVSVRLLELAKVAWYSFSAETPAAWAELLNEDISALPFLRAAILRSLEELPSPQRGVGRTELAALRAIANGARTRGAIFAATQEDEEAPFISEQSFFRRLDRLAGSSTPLVTGMESAMPALTPLGLDVLAGRSDAAAWRPIDCWLGGANITNGNLWRWDDLTCTLIAP
jgi:hypothetical protein